MFSALGAEIPSEREANFRKVRIEWKNKVLWASPWQLLQAEGNLNNLEVMNSRPFCSTKIEYFPKKNETEIEDGTPRDSLFEHKFN